MKLTRPQAEKLNLLYLRLGTELQSSSEYLKQLSTLEDQTQDLLPTSKVMASLYFELMEPLYREFPDLLPEHLDGTYKPPAEVLTAQFDNN